ncbi:MAG: alpha/beta hydrolase [Acidimicrobiales bacterium]|jgi:peroxiredoxin|nr:alpha/beta hydrolase [Acidimicrobiales bacterium]
MENEPGESEIEPTRLTFHSTGGVGLVADRRGTADAPPVLLLHGGGQTRHSWDGTARTLAEKGWQAITVDARGHGESDWSEATDYRLVSFAADVQVVAESLAERPFLIGASLGGLTSMLLAGELAPGIARGVVLVDIIPDMEPGGASRIQSFMAEHAVTGFDSLEEVADAIAAYNPHRPRPTDLSGLAKNVRERDGRYYWHWDPAFVGGTADLPPSEIGDKDRLHRAVEVMVASGPVLLVRGRVSDLVSPERCRRFLERFPEVEFVDVAGAGHMVAGDRNDLFTAAVLDFLDRHREGSPSQ